MILQCKVNQIVRASVSVDGSQKNACKRIYITKELVTDRDHRQCRFIYNV